MLRHKTESHLVTETATMPQHVLGGWIMIPWLHSFITLFIQSIFFLSFFYQLASVLGTKNAE